MATYRQGLGGPQTRASQSNSPADAILAAIVEKETGKPEGAGRGLFNRLRQNMMLQADPTFIYPVPGQTRSAIRPLLSEVREGRLQHL